MFNRLRMDQSEYVYIVMITEFVYTNILTIQFDFTTKVYTYLISRISWQPYTLEGFKFDLRVYVLVTSCDPLRVFLYNDGLVSRNLFSCNLVL